MDSFVSLRKPSVPAPIAIAPDGHRSNCDEAFSAAEPADFVSEASWRSRLIFGARSWLGSLVIHLTGTLVLALVLGIIPPVVRQAPQYLTFALPDGDQGELVNHFTLGGGSPSASDGTSSSSAIDELFKAEPTPLGEHFLLPSMKSSIEDRGSSTLAALDHIMAPLPPAGGANGGTKAGGGGTGNGGSGGNGLSGKGGMGTRFFGVPAGGHKFVYIVDSSHSMSGEKFATAQEEVLYAISQLQIQQSFYVFFFDQVTQAMVLPPDKEPPPLPVPATRQNIKRATKWIKQVETGSNTHPYEAVKLALEMKPDAIFLLTDGQFSDAGQTEQFLLINNVLNKSSAEPQVIVHTIGFWDLSGQEALQRIARRNGGTYRFVPPGGR